jgi:hypothetical protein
MRLDPMVETWRGFEQDESADQLSFEETAADGGSALGLAAEPGARSGGSDSFGTATWEQANG